MNVPLDLIKAIFGPKLKGMSVRDFKAALGNPDFTKRKVRTEGGESCRARVQGKGGGQWWRFLGQHTRGHMA